MAKLLFTAVILVVVLTVTTTDLTEAQSTTCASKLVACYEYLNGTVKPTSTCCDPIKEAVKTELSCLCTLYTTPGLLSSFNVSVAQALNLTKECGVPTDINNCNSSTSTAESPTNSPPGGVPGNDGGIISARNMAWTGILSILLLSIM